MNVYCKIYSMISFCFSLKGLGVFCSCWISFFYAQSRAEAGVRNDFPFRPEIFYSSRRVNIKVRKALVWLRLCNGGVCLKRRTRNAALNPFTNYWLSVAIEWSLFVWGQVIEHERYGPLICIGGATLQKLTVFLKF